MTQTIVYILICIYVLTFLVHCIDKWKAKQGSWRIYLIIQNRDTMKKILFAFAVLLAMAACTNKPVTAVENNTEESEVAFEVAKNYFFKNDQVIPEYPKITTGEEFNKLFGMATTMGEEGKPTAIDFTKQFVLAIVLPVTDFATEINPVKVEEKGDSLLYTYEVKTGEKQSFTVQPVSIIILDKKHEDKEVVLVNKQAITRLQAIVDYLSKEIGSQYAKGEHCVPFYTIISWDDSNTEDVKIWG